MKALLTRGIPVASSCHGEGICKKCVLEVREVAVLTSSLTIQEEEQISNSLHRENESRMNDPHSSIVLSCQYLVDRDIELDTSYW